MRHEEEVFDVRIVVALCAAVLLLLFVGKASAEVIFWTSYDSFDSYSPGEQQGSGYDCPYINVLWIRNDFRKLDPRLGKSIFINTSGSWIAHEENDNYRTILNRPDLETTTKKASVKNTSAYTYIGNGELFRDDTHFCI